MIQGIKSMIAGCIDRMRTDGCGGCERRDACAELFAGLFGPRRAPPPRRAGGGEPFLRSVFLNVIGQVVRNVEAGRRTQPPAPPKPARETGEPGRFRREVERRLEPLLAGGPISIDAVARTLGLSRQTLYRRLRAEGTTFAELLDGLRRRLALTLIRDERVPVKEAAWRLGFSDPAAFSRAFKRWTGRSPSEMRGG